MMTWGVGDVAQLRQLIASRRERGAPARRAAEAERAARLLRDGAVPAPGPAAVFRRDAARALRQLRHLPRAGPDLGRHHRRAEGAVGGPTHGRALRPELSDRPPARPRRRAHVAARPRPAADLRRRRRPRPARLAVGVPPARGGRLARGRPGRLRRDAACRRCGQGAARRARRWSCATTRRPRADRAAPREPSAPAGLARDADRDLFEALRAKRRELAKANGLAPFMVFPDRTLIELAAKKPADSAALETIHGIGQAKRERWGEDFLRVIREARQDRHGAGTDARRTSDPPDDRQPAPRPIATAP